MGFDFEMVLFNALNALSRKCAFFKDTVFIKLIHRFWKEDFSLVFPVSNTHRYNIAGQSNI